MTNAYQNSDDFPIALQESTTDIHEVYQSFLECEPLIQSVPKSHRGHNYYLSLNRLLKESLRSRKEGQPLFRKRTDASEVVAHFWLSKVREAAWFFSAWNNLPNFDGLDKSVLTELSRLSIESADLPNLADILLSYGVILVHERAIPGMKIDGACFLLETGHPVVALSLRYSRLDIYWFTLLHELAHIVLHHDILTTPILDNFDEESSELIELQANKLASDSLINRSDWRNCNAKYDMKEKVVIDFAKQVGVHPSIVAGRLQRELNRHDIFSKIIHRENTRKIIFGDE